jgi:hypothetical protein
VAFAVTLEKMARGGVYDQLAGGFHRYSWTSAGWFRTSKNALRQHRAAAQLRARLPEFCAARIFWKRRPADCGWLDATMTDRERGGFYASQDADINLDDDGDYFTWTLTKRAAVLTRRSWSLPPLLGYWRTGRHAPQPGQERAAHQADAGREGAGDGGDLRSLRACATRRGRSCWRRAGGGLRRSSTARSTPAGTRWR